MQCQFMAALNNLHVQILATKLQNPSAMIQWFEVFIRNNEESS
jgi:hypothetical protein